MPITDIKLPQMGEGLQEALIVVLLKQPGDQIKRDEPIYEMETDKAIMTVESPYDGTLQEWLVEEDDVVPIGAAVARIETDDVVVDDETEEEMQTEQAQPEPDAPVKAPRKAAKTGLRIPPRTRAHARQLGIPEDELLTIPASSGKLMPQDLDHYVALKSATEEDGEAPFVERHLSKQQRALVYRLRRSAQLVIPATITRQLAWSTLEKAEKTLQNKGLKTPVTKFETLAYCVTSAAREFPAFRSQLLDDDTVREHRHLNPGFAVQRPGDELVTAVVPDADCLSFSDFTQALQEKVAMAIEGKDQANDSVQLMMTFMGDAGITQAVPTLVAPAIATLFVGAPIGDGPSTVVNLTLTFDHRLINGVGAASYLGAIIREVEGCCEEKLSKERKDVSRSVAAGTDSDIHEKILAAIPDKRVALLESHISSCVVDMLDMASAKIKKSVPLRTLGLNSLMSVELSNRLGRDLGIPVPATLVWNYSTVAAIAGYLIEKLERRAASDTDETRNSEVNSVDSEKTQDINRLLDEIEMLSEDEATRKLRKE